MKTCVEFKENISLYIDGELAADERRLFEEHLESCPECRDEYDEILRIAGLCRDMQDVELPDNFREELHRKLIDAAAEAVPGNAARQRMKYFRIFSSIAAGIVLIFLFGSVYRFGFSPQLRAGGDAGNAMMKSAAAPEAPAEKNAASLETAAADADVQFGGSVTAGGSPIIPGETSEAGRATTKDRNLQGPMMASSESIEVAYSKTATFTVLAGDPASQAEAVRTIAANSGGEEQPDEASGGEIVLTFSIPDNRYEEFASSLNSGFGQSNVKLGAQASQDMTETLSRLIEESNALDTEIKKLEDAGSKKYADEINGLESKKQKLQGDIEDIRLNSDFTAVMITIKKK